MAASDPTDRVLERLVERLPSELRREWVVLPRRFLLQLFLTSFMLGASIALLAAGLVLDVSALKWAFPAVLLALMVARRYAPWWRDDRFEEQLRKAGLWKRDGRSSVRFPP